MKSRSLVLTAVAALSTVGVVLSLTRESTVTTVAAGQAGPDRTSKTNDEPADAPAARPETPARAPEVPALPVLPEKPLAAYQVNLLDLASLAASAVPTFPHIKMRSRLQEQVVVACLELEQPRRALEVVEQMKNWRRGIGYADVAFFCAKSGHQSAVPAYLERARAEVEGMNLQAMAEEQGYDGDDEAIEGYQSWRRDRVRAKIARTYLFLRQDDKAIEFEEGLEDSEVGVVEVVRAEYLGEDQVANAAMALESIVADGSLDEVRTALRVGLVLLRRFDQNESLRALLRTKIEGCLEKTPLLIRVDTLIALAEGQQNDSSAARAFLERARETLARNPLAIEDELPLRARLAVARHRVGEGEAARADLAAIVQRFEAGRAELPDLLRADVLIPIAEAYAVVQDRAGALELYRRAAADGAENPNAGARSEDFVAQCCSMARHGIEPDEELWRALRAAHALLRGPW
jgi:hypothetical protein